MPTPVEHWHKTLDALFPHSNLQWRRYPKDPKDERVYFWAARTTIIEVERLRKDFRGNYSRSLPQLRKAVDTLHKYYENFPFIEGILQTL